MVRRKQRRRRASDDDIDPMAGTTVEEGTVINVTLKQYVKDAH